MTAFELNSAMKVTFTYVGDEQVPLWIINDFVTFPKQLVELADDGQENNVHSDNQFRQQNSDFYPGIRKTSPTGYGDMLSELVSLIKQEPQFSKYTVLNPIMSAYSIATTAPNILRPIQMLPHFDAPISNQLAVVHYLCDEQHGGTSFYRHRNSNFEQITQSRVHQYQTKLKQQAVAEKLHLKPQYINGTTDLFEQIYCVEAKFNRAIIYPSNALHSGNINADAGLNSAPSKGRLTISSFISLI